MMSIAIESDDFFYIGLSIEHVRQTVSQGRGESYVLLTPPYPFGQVFGNPIV